MIVRAVEDDEGEKGESFGQVCVCVLLLGWIKFVFSGFLRFGRLYECV